MTPIESIVFHLLLLAYKIKSEKKHVPKTEFSD